MIVTNLQIAPYTPERVTVSWTTSQTTYTPWVFVDGILQDEEVSLNGTTRSVIVEWAYDESHSIEVQELPSTITEVTPVTPPALIQPTITWNATTDAELYRIYHRETASGTDTLIYEDSVTPDSFNICRVTCPIELDGRGGTWQFFRVEAVDLYGNESTRVSWLYWAAEPDDVVTLAITEGTEAGKYDLTLTE